MPERMTNHRRMREMAMKKRESRARRGPVFWWGEDQLVACCGGDHVVEDGKRDGENHQLTRFVHLDELSVKTSRLIIMVVTERVGCY